jgi:hypothetical protein
MLWPRAMATDTITDELIADIAKEADSHRQSVLRRLLGLPVKGRSGRRIDRVLAARGLLTEPEARAS